MLASNIVAKTYTAVGLTAGQTYKFKVESRNSFGFSVLSEEVAIIAAAIPDAPINLSNDASITSADQIGISWQDGSFNGGISVIDYRVSYD